MCVLGMLLTACCAPCTVLRLLTPGPTPLLGGLWTGRATILPELVAFVTTWPDGSHFWTPASPSLNSVGAFLGVVHAADSGSHGGSRTCPVYTGLGFFLAPQLQDTGLLLPFRLSVPDETPWIGTLYILAPSAFLQTVKPSSSSSLRGMQTCLDVLIWSRWVSPHQGDQLTGLAQD